MITLANLTAKIKKSLLKFYHVEKKSDTLRIEKLVGCAYA